MLLSHAISMHVFGHMEGPRHSSRVGEAQSEGRTVGADSRVPGPATRPGPSDSQVLRHPDAARGRGIAEKGVGAHRLDIAQDGRGKSSRWSCSG